MLALLASYNWGIELDSSSYHKWIMVFPLDGSSLSYIVLGIPIVL